MAEPTKLVEVLSLLVGVTGLFIAADQSIRASKEQETRQERPAAPSASKPRRESAPTTVIKPKPVKNGTQPRWRQQAPAYWLESDDQDRDYHLPYYED
jgi:hypothetical protein